MKNKIALGLAAFVALTNVKAGDREWATVGKVLTGVAALHVVERIVCPPQPQVVYVSQPVVVQSAPVRTICTSTTSCICSTTCLLLSTSTSGSCSWTLSRSLAQILKLSLNIKLLGQN
jgi:hypothetical protein